jgi:hypothetical protein
MIDVVFMMNRYFIFAQVSDLCNDYRRSMNAEITESMNTFWAECYESYKNALDTRSRLVAESRKSFQVPYKTIRHLICAVGRYLYAFFFNSIIIQVGLIHYLDFRDYCNLIT